MSRKPAPTKAVPVKPQAKSKASKAKRRRASATAPKTYRWTGKLPILARAMVLARDTLLFAGPPDIFSSDEPAAALAGKKQGKLLLVSASDGKQLAQCELRSPPGFDGMAVADGRVYLATLDSHVVCLGGSGR